MPFFHFAGLNALDVFDMLTFNEDSDDKKLGKLLEKFEAYCILYRSIMWEQHIFNTRNQKFIDEHVSNRLHKKPRHVFQDLMKAS